MWGFSLSPTPHHSANTHTVFNIFVALVFLPLTGPVTALMYKLIPKDAQELGKAKQ